MAMVSLLKLLPLLPLLSSATTPSCHDPQTPSSIIRGENTTVCLYVGPGGDWNSDIEYMRFGVNLVADEFSSYKIPGCKFDVDRNFNAFKRIVQSNPFGWEATHVFAASQTSYHDTTTQTIYPYLTAIIDVREGTVRGIAWDDACIFCQLSRCLPNTYNFNGTAVSQEQIRQPSDGCYFSTEECVALHAGGSDVCDLKMFVVWTGTAVGGKVLLSSDSRFSAFPPNRIQEHIQNGVDSALGSLNDIKESVTDTVTDTMDSVTDAVENATDFISGTRRV